jgi:hypothetical protein
VVGLNRPIIGGGRPFELPKNRTILGRLLRCLRIVGGRW